MDVPSRRFTDSNDFHSIIASATDGFLLVDRNGIILEVNDSYCQLTGYTRDEILDRHISEVDPIDSAEDVARRSEEIAKAGSLRFESYHRHKNGTFIPLEVSLNYTSLRGGSFFSFFRDISQKKQLEVEHRKSEERYRIIFDQSLDAIFYTNPNGDIFKANPSACKMFGMTEEELCAVGREGIINKKDPRLAPAVERGKQSRQINTELTAVRKNGEIFPIEVSSVITSEEPPQSFVIIRDISERKWSEQQLIRSEEKFSTAFKASPEAIAIVSLDSGKYLEVNDNFLLISGFSREEVIGHTATELNVWVDIQERQAYLDDLALRGSSKRSEIKFRMKNNDVRLFHVSSEVIEIDGLKCSLNFISDITEQKRAEEILRLSEEKFSTAFRVSPDAINLTRLCDGRYIDVNDGFTEITGYTAEDAIGKTSLELKLWVNPEDRVRLTSELKEKGVVKNLEAQFRRKDGSILTGFMSARMLEIEGEPCLLSITRDHSERKRMEDALRESEYFFKESQRAARIGSYSADFPADHWNSSEVLDTIFGIDNSYDRSIQGWLDIVHCDDRKMMEKYLSGEIIKGRKPFSKEYRITRHSDGETRWVSGLGEATFDDGGAIVLLTGTIQDITERKYSEEERTNLEKQLLHAQKMESLGVLAGGIAHDFNNILAIIKGNCSLAMMDYKNAEDYIAKIDKATDRAAGLCRQMLTYAGKAQLTQAQITMQTLVDEMVNMLKTTLPRNVVIKSDLPYGIPDISGDPTQIRQIVMNLIINASEAIGEEQGEIFVSLSKSVVKAERPVTDYHGKAIAPGWYTCLEVTDSGSGMDKETMQRIFEPFFTTKFTGRGLGMAAVLGIILSHQGSLQLFSQPGQGTTFKIFLPVLISDAPAEETPQQHDPSELWTGSGTVLLVEDEEMIRAVAKDMFEILGFDILEATNGREALELYQNNRASIICVVTDMGMPVMDGYALFAELKKCNPDLPIIISSGFGDSVVTSRIAQENIAGLVSKPFSFYQLREIMKDVLQNTPTKHT